MGQGSVIPKMFRDEEVALGKPRFAILFLAALVVTRAPAQDTSPPDSAHAHAEHQASPQQDTSMAGMQMPMPMD